MGRSLKKGPYVDAKVYGKVDKLNQQGIKEAITTWARACTIIPEFVGHTFMVHNGKTHLKVFVTEDMVGHRLGEFAPTRSFRGHGGKAKAEAKAGAGGGAGGGGGGKGG
jgi:small subunit ribosomal protein S19